MDPIQSPDHQRPRAAQQAPRCQHIRFNGQPCAAPALRGQAHCHFHDRLHDPQTFNHFSMPFIEDATSLQLALMQVMRALVMNDIEPKHCALLFYGLQIACTNLKSFMAEHPTPELAEGEQPQTTA